jgi:hypothetical protein
MVAPLPCSIACSSDDSGPAKPGPTIAGCRVFPADNAWNQDISGLTVHVNSELYVNSLGSDRPVVADFGAESNGVTLGIPYLVVNGSEPRVPVEFLTYGNQSDPGPYPIPLSSPIEGGPNSQGDRHVLAIDSSTCKLYELYAAYPKADHWEARSGAIWDLSRNTLRPPGFTSADAAGLPIFPGLVRYDEVVEKKQILHALRFTVATTQAGFVLPATHYASSNTDPNLPPMGLRFRMKAGYDCSHFSSEVQVICTALKHYGMLVADNGQNWHLSGAPDSRWDSKHLGDLTNITGSAFEVVNTGKIRTQ